MGSGARTREGGLGRLTDDELDRTEGKWDRLVGLIKERTGDVERKLRELFDKI